MKKQLFLLGALITAANVYAADINCSGKVSWVMDYPSQCDGNTAFKTTGSGDKWVCPPSDKGNALVLAALAADKRLEVYIDSQNGAFSCNNLPNYVKARYIIINP
uniref:hypothetical protein n=1 Tax=Rheinheimera sp. TaxID=1869214 RepID=UPI0040483230